MPETTVERWLSLPEAAKYVGVAMRTMYNLVGRREIRATGWPMGISQSELEDFTRRSRIKPGQLRRLYERPTVTWSTYQHVTPAMATDAAERVAGLIFGEKC